VLDERSSTPTCVRIHGINATWQVGRPVGSAPGQPDPVCPVLAAALSAHGPAGLAGHGTAALVDDGGARLSV